MQWTCYKAFSVPRMCVPNVWKPKQRGSACPRRISWLPEWLWLFRMKNYWTFPKAAAVQMAPTPGGGNICTNPWIGDSCQDILGTNWNPRGKYLLDFRTIEMLKSPQDFQRFSVFLSVLFAKPICCSGATMLLTVYWPPVSINWPLNSVAPYQTDALQTGVYYSYIC